VRFNFLLPLVTGVGTQTRSRSLGPGLIFFNVAQPFSPHSHLVPGVGTQTRSRSFGPGLNLFYVA